MLGFLQAIHVLQWHFLASGHHTGDMLMMVHGQWSVCHVTWHAADAYANGCHTP